MVGLVISLAPDDLTLSLVPNGMVLVYEPVATGTPNVWDDTLTWDDTETWNDYE